MKLQLKDGQRVFFSSDFHYAHKNITGPKVSQWGSGYRNFESTEEMNQELIKNINTKVKHDDILFFLGDWTFGGFENIKKFRDQIHCRTIHFIIGNHDHHIEMNKDGIRGIFTTVNHYLEVDIEGIKFILFHFPIASWHHMMKDKHIHLFGHCHSKFERMVGKMMDVGVDNNELFEPYSMEEILKIMSKIDVAKSEN